MKIVNISFVKEGSSMKVLVDLVRWQAYLSIFLQFHYVSVNQILWYFI